MIPELQGEVYGPQHATRVRWNPAARRQFAGIGVGTTPPQSGIEVIGAAQIHGTLECESLAPLGRFESLGPELIKNPDFADDLTGWGWDSEYGDWLWDSGAATTDPANGYYHDSIFQTVTVTPGSYYLLSWTTTNHPLGSGLSLGTGAVSVPGLGWVYRATSAAMSFALVLENSESFEGRLERASVRELVGWEVPPSLLVRHGAAVTARFRFGAAGSEIVGIGAAALDRLLSGTQLTVIGRGAAAGLLQGSNLLALGTDALGAATSANNCIALGTRALGAVTSATDIIAIGTDAGAEADRDGGLFIGLSAGRRCKGQYCLYIGSGAGYGPTAGSIGAGNIGIGSGALRALTTGEYNWAAGYNAGGALTSGSRNFLAGYFAGAALTTGGNNFAAGFQAGRLLTTGTGNLLLGINSGQYLTTAASCIYIQADGFGFSTTNNRLAIGDAIVGDLTTGNLDLKGGWKTAAPAGGTAGRWKLGTRTAGTYTVGGKVRVEIDGVAVDLLTT